MYKVLLVDDEELERKVIGYTLQNSGLPIEIVGEAANGRECLEETLRTKPDMIIMDIKMPGIDGIEATRRVRQLYPSIEVIILTAYSKFSYSLQAIKAQASDYLLKPVQPQELIKSVQLAIARTARNKFKPGMILDMSSFVEQIRLGNLAEGKHQLALLIELFAAKEPECSPAGLNSFGLRLLVLSVQSVLAEGISTVELAVVEDEFTKTLNQVNNYDDLRAWGENLLVKCLEILKSRQIGNDQVIVRKATDYIDQNYAAELSLNRVAAQVHLSPAYLSRIFTKKMGVSFTDYLAMVRLKAAKYLLRVSEDTIDQIATQTGFSSNSYFTSVFKKYEGVTPSEYRSETRK